MQTMEIFRSKCKPLLQRGIRRSLVATVLLMVVLSAGMPGLAAFAADERPQRQWGVEDVLNMQMLGSGFVYGTYAWINDALYFEQTPRVRDRPFFQAGDALASSRIYVIEANSRKAKQLLTDDLEAGFRIASVSPTGKKMLLRRTTAEGTAVVSIDLATQDRVTYEPTPFNDWEDKSFTWLSDDQFLYSVRDTNDGNNPTRQIHAAADALAKAWLTTRLGSAAATSTLSSRSVPEWPRPVPGSLMLADAGTGNTVAIADGVLLNLILSPSKKYAVARQRGEFIATRSMDSMFTPFVDTPKVVKLNGKDRADVYDVCANCEIAPKTIVWSPSRDILYFFARPRFKSWRDGSYFRYDATTRATERMDIGGRTWAGWEYFQSRLSSEPKPHPLIPLRNGHAVLTVSGKDSEKNEWVYFPEGSSEGRVISGHAAGFSGAPVAYGGSCLIALGDGDIWRLCSNAEPRNLTPDTHRVTGVFSDQAGASPAMMPIDSKPKRVLLESIADRQTTVAFLDISTGNVAPVAGLESFEFVQSISPSGDAVITLRSDTSGATLFRIDRSSRRTALHRLNTHIAEVQWPRIDNVTYQFGDETLSSCVYRMPGQADPRKTPVIVYVYPDIASKQDCNTMHSGGGIGTPLMLGGIDLFSPSYLATMGYTVVTPATPTRLLDSPDESSANLSKLLEYAVDAVGERGWGDASRAGLFGISQGGYSVIKALTQTTRFKGAVAGISQVDHTSHYADFHQIDGIVPNFHGWGNSVWYESDNGVQAPGSPWEEPQWYVRSSPYFHLDNIATPLLLIGADLDSYASLNQYNMLFTALWLQKRDVDFVRYWGEGHGIENPHNIRDYDARVREWFDGLLRHDRLPPPGNEWPTTRFDQRE